VQDRKRKLSHISSSLSSGYVQSYGALAKKKAGFTDHYSTIFMTHGLSGEQESCNICNQPVRVCCLWPDGDPLAFDLDVFVRVFREADLGGMFAHFV
jgi:hypothetical protein